MTKQDHLTWAKERAMQYVDMGDLTGAANFFISDLGKHSELSNHPVIVLIDMHQVSGLFTEQTARSLIGGTN